MKQKFPLKHVVQYTTKEVWVECNSSITAMGIPALVKKYYPGYTARIANSEYLDKLRNQLVNWPQGVIETLYNPYND